MKIILTKDLEEFIASKVRLGGYKDPSAVVRAALRQMKACDERLEAAVLDGLDGEITPLTRAELQGVRNLIGKKARN